MARQPEPWKLFSKRIYEIERQLNGLQRRSPFSGTGFQVMGPQQMYFDGSLELTGTLEAHQVISNDALISPVVPGIGRADSDTFSITTTATEKAGVTLTVPSGTTSLLATVAARVATVNANTTGGSNGAGGDAIYCLSKLDTQSSVATPTGISGSNGFATASSTESYVVTGLTPGGTLRLSAYAASGYQTIPSNAGAYASVCASLVWLR